MQVNIPEVVAELIARFEAYEQALVVRVCRAGRSKTANERPRVTTA